MTNILTRDSRGGLLGGRERPVRPGLVLAVVLIGQFMAVLDASIVNVAAPSIHAHLGASGAGLQLVVAGYTITYAVLLVTGARLGDILEMTVDEIEVASGKSGEMTGVPTSSPTGSMPAWWPARSCASRAVLSARSAMSVGRPTSASADEYSDRPISSSLSWIRVPSAV